MGTAYVKTSPTNFVDGETIQASDFTTEFGAIDAAFETGGHQHDGTDGEGGVIEKLLSNTITLGTGADTDIALTFNANTADGVLTWMEDEDYFKFSDDVLVDTTEKIQFRDTAIYINSSADGQLDLVADTEIQLAATTVDLNGNLDVSGTIGIGSAVLTEAELEMLDGITAGTAAASKAVVLSADRDIATVRNITSDGTIQFGSLSDGSITATAFIDEDDMASNSATLIPTQQSVKAYVDGSAQTMGDGFILEDGDGTEVAITETKEVKFVEGGGIDINWTDTDNGTDGDPYDLTFTLAAAQTGITSVTNAALTIGRDVDNDIDFATDNNIIFRASGADQVKIIDGVLAPVSDNDVDLGSGSLQFKDAYIHGTLEADAITIGGTAIASVLSPVAGSSSIVTTGALDAGSITSGFGAINNGASTITTTGAISGGSLTLSTDLAVSHGGTGSSSAGDARVALGAAALGANSDITSLTGLTTDLSVAQGGTGAGDAAGARSNIGAAALGANSDITSLTGLTTDLSVAQGGTGAGDAAGARSNIGAAALGANTFTGTQSLADNIVERPLLQDYGEIVNAIGGTGGGTQAIDLTLGNVVSATVDTSANTFTFTNPTATGKNCGFILYLTNGGSQTVNWPAAVDYPGGTAPTLTASGVDILVFNSTDAGTRWYGNLVGAAYA